MSGINIIVSTLTILFKQLNKISEQKIIIPIIQQISHQFSIRNNSFNFNLTENEMYTIILGDCLKQLSNDSKITFDNLVKTINNILDINQDGIISEKDLTSIFKQHNYHEVVTIIIQTLYVMNTYNTIFKMKLTKSNIIDIGYTVLLYIIFLPLGHNDQNFINFISTDNGAILLAECLNYIYITVETSDILDNVVKKLTKIIKNPFNKSSSDDKIQKLKTNTIMLVRKANLNVNFLLDKKQILLDSSIS